MFHALHRTEKGEWWHNELYRLIASGEIIKPEVCSKCSSSIESRHLHGHCVDDYAVSPKINCQWLCAECHYELHGRGRGFADCTEEDARYYAQQGWVTRRLEGTASISAQRGHETRRRNGTNKTSAQKRLETIGSDGFHRMAQKSADSQTPEERSEKSRRSIETRRREGTLHESIQRGIETLREKGTLDQRAQKVWDARKKNGTSHNCGPKKGSKGSLQIWITRRKNIEAKRQATKELEDSFHKMRKEKENVH